MVFQAQFSSFGAGRRNLAVHAIAKDGGRRSEAVA